MSEQPKHIPGPWRIGKNCGAIVADVPIQQPPAGMSESEFAREQSGEIEYYGGYLICESVAVRNQPVIAAAPELLEACRNALVSLRAWNTMGLYGPAAKQRARLYEQSPEIKQLLDVIAKAEGAL